MEGQGDKDKGSTYGRYSEKVEETGQVVQEDFQDISLRMACLSSLKKLLENKIVEMESKKRGTGSLENDIRLLEN